MPTPQPFEFRRSRDFGESFSALFEFLRNNIRNLFKSLLFIAGPLILILGLVGSYIGSSNVISTLSGANPNPEQSSGQTGVFAIGVILFVIVYFFTLAIILSIICEYIRYSMETSEDKELFSVSLLRGRIKDRFSRHIGNFFMMNCIASLSMLPFIIVAVIISMIGFERETSITIYFILLLGALFVIAYVVTALTLLPMMRTMEEIDIVDAIRRSFFLIQKHFWATLGFYIVVWIIQMVILYGISIPLNLIITKVPPLLFPEAADGSVGFGSFSVILQIIFTGVKIVEVGLGLILNAMAVTGHALQYFNLVEQKEGVGMMSKLELIGTPEFPAENLDTAEEY